VIYLRSTLREFTASGVGIFVVLLAITFTSLLIRLLGSAARGRIPADAVFTLIGFGSLRYVSVLLSATLFLAILFTLTRAYRDSEMVVWQSSGVSLLQWCKPVLVFALPVVIAITALSLYLTPWAFGEAERYRHQLENRDDVSAVTPGVFKESRNADRVFFVERLSSDLTQVANVFVHSVQNERQGVMVASRGYVETADSGDRYLVMLNGRRYEGTPGQADYRVVSFGRYAVRIEQSEAKAFFPTQRSLPTTALLADRTPANLGELAVRIGLPISTVLLALLAIPMSAVNPRTGRSVNVIMAVFVYMIYSNLVSLSETWISRGRIPPLLGLTGVHLLMLAVLVLLFAWRLGLLRRVSLRPAPA
jgi:lipopolysaccharide export system permease protein